MCERINSQKFIITREAHEHIDARTHTHEKKNTFECVRMCKEEENKKKEKQSKLAKVYRA
jgi:hypothetical protein